MRAQSKPVMILELNLGCPVTEAAVLHKAGLSFGRAIGSYKGVQNSSYIVDVSKGNGNVDQDKMQAVFNLAQSYKQESVLFVDLDNSAVLVYTDGSGQSVGLGTMRPVPEGAVQGLEAWTYAVNLDTYYVAS